MTFWKSVPALQAFPSAMQAALGTRVLLDRAAHLSPQFINWIWSGHIAIGKLNLLAGSPGTGKSGIALYLAAAVSRGSAECPLPDGSVARQGHVVILASEDGVEDTIIPRLLAAGANTEFVHIVRGTMVNGRPRPFCADDCERLSSELDKLVGVRLVIIDPITQMVRKNGNSNSEVRNALEPLVGLAERHGFAILGVAHLAKGSQKRSPLERVAGSLAFGALSRIVLLTVRGEQESEDGGSSSPAQCALVRIKSNIGADGGGFSYTVRPAEFTYGFQQFKSSAIRWGARLSGSAKSIIEAMEGGGGEAGSTALARAKAFLTEFLRSGPQLATFAQNAAAEASISAGTLRRAREELGIEVARLRDGAQASPWLWSLPGNTDGRRHSLDVSGGAQVSDFLFAPIKPPFAGPPLAAVPGSLPSAINLGQPAHDAQVGHLAQHGQVEQVAQVAPVVTHLDATNLTPPPPVGIGAEAETADESYLDTLPIIDPDILRELVEDCYSARKKLADVFKDDDDTLERIERDALTSRVQPADRAAYRQALLESDWSFLP